MILQPLLLNGKNGATGPIVQLLVAKGSNSEPVDAVNQLLEATISVPEIQQRLKIARHLSVQVI